MDWYGEVGEGGWGVGEWVNPLGDVAYAITNVKAIQISLYIRLSHAHKGSKHITMDRLLNFKLVLWETK